MKLASLLLVVLVFGLISGCTKNSGSTSQTSSSKTETTTSDKSVGVGPIKKLTLDKDINEASAKKGKEIFTTKCSACHKIGERYVGPDLNGVTVRRSPEWIMNMILNPVEMTQKDEAAQALFGEYLTQMTFQNVTEQESRDILEYFRKHDKK